MKQKDKQIMQKMSISELQKEVADLRVQWKKIRGERFVKEMKNSRESKTIRNKIAIVLTYMKEKQIQSVL